MKSENTKRTIVSKAKRAQIVAALGVCSNAAKVARENDVSHWKVWHVARQEGIELSGGHAAKGPHRRVRAEDVDLIVAALKADPFIERVKHKFPGRSTSTLWRIAKRHGVVLAHPGAARVASRREAIVAALRMTPNATVVAQEIGGLPPDRRPDCARGKDQTESRRAGEKSTPAAMMISRRVSFKLVDSCQLKAVATSKKSSANSIINAILTEFGSGK